MPAKMPAKTQPALVDAVQSVFEALEPFDDAARQRIIASVVSLLGGSTAITTPIHTSPASHSPQISAPARTTGERPLSPVEILQEKQPATHMQKIAVFAYYRERSEGLSRFSKDDLKAYFAKAKQPPPQNFDREYREAVKEGWIYDDGADSYLTSKGLEAVEAGFGGKQRPRGAPVAKNKTSKARKGRK